MSLLKLKASSFYGVRGDTSDLESERSKGRILFFPSQEPIDAAPIEHALRRQQEDRTVVLAMPRATYLVEGVRFAESRNNHREVYRAGWCRSCKHRLSACECRDVEAGHHDPRELDFG